MGISRVHLWTFHLQKIHLEGLSPPDVSPLGVFTSRGFRLFNRLINQLSVSLINLFTQGTDTQAPTKIDEAVNAEAHRGSASRWMAPWPGLAGRN